MRPAAFSLAAIAPLALALALSIETRAQAPNGASPSVSITTPPAPVRAAPARPVALAPGLRVGNVDYVTATDLALWLGFKGTWSEPLKTIALVDKTNSANHAELSADAREAGVNGLRVFLGEKVFQRDGHLYVSRTDAERALAPLLRPGLGASLLPAPKIIVLDPGHGGDDPGAENKAFGLREKTLTLDVALRLKKLLEAAGFKVLLTREADIALAGNKAVDLALRPDFANRAHADLFISIHFNAAAKDTRGTEVFTYAPRAQHATDWWGQLSRDDAALEKTEQPINRFDHWSATLAGALHRRMLQTLRTEDRGKKIAHWAVLKTLNCPGVLVEPAIITNDSDARRVAAPAFRQQIAEALAAGVSDYAATLDSLRPKTQPAAATAFPSPASNSR
jgi:N-acetylmuramoyl-L-alanine amidase